MATKKKLATKKTYCVPAMVRVMGHVYVEAENAGRRGHNYFFHKSSVQRTGVGTDAFYELAAGDMVTFEAQAAPKRPRATGHLTPTG